MSLVRRYKISKVLNKPLTGFDKEVIDFIEGWLKDLTIIRIEDIVEEMSLDDYPNLRLKSVFYMSPSGKFVFEDKKVLIKTINADNLIMVRWEDLWATMYQKFSIDDEVTDILTFMIKNRFGFNYNIEIAVADSKLIGEIEEVYSKIRNTVFNNQ